MVSREAMTSVVTQTHNSYQNTLPKYRCVGLFVDWLLRRPAATFQLFLDFLRASDQGYIYAHMKEQLLQRRRRRRGPQAGGGHRAFGRCLLAIEKAGGQSRVKTPGRDNRHRDRRPAEAQAAEHGANAQVPAPHPGRLLQGLAPGAGAGPPRA